jgi:hypothetical protein
MACAFDFHQAIWFLSPLIFSSEEPQLISLLYDAL